MNTYPQTLRHQTGISMIEVLVTLVILLVGLLGLAGMMMQSQRAETESYQRVQATMLLQDMVSRINTNRKVASCYVITTTTNGTPYLGNGTTLTTPTCTAGTAEQNALAIQDMKDWTALLQGAAESSDGNNVGAMLGARGCISVDATTGTYLVSIAWQGTGTTAAPPANWVCATGLYGSETLGQRRVVAATLKIGALT